MSEEHLKALYDKLQKKVEACIDRNNRAFVIGGSKDMILPISLGYSENDLFVVVTNQVDGKT